MNNELICMADIESKEITWLWYPYIPFGKITIIQGELGEGKIFALNLIACLSNGTTLDGKDIKPFNIIYQSSEDGLSDTIKPRLENANADCSKVFVIDESLNPLSMDDIRLETAIKELNAKVVILDPIQAYLGNGTNINRANEVREKTKRLEKIAEKYSCAIILVGHMNKASGMKATYRGSGSIDFLAAARSVLVVEKIKDNPNLSIIVHIKSNHSALGETNAFSLENGVFSWLGYYQLPKLNY